MRVVCRELGISDASLWPDEISRGERVKGVRPCL
jgi:hypothetical protein